MKVLFVLEYDLHDVEELEEARGVLLDNIALVSEEGVRPTQAHLISDLSAFKVLSVIKSEVMEGG